MNQKGQVLFITLFVSIIVLSFVLSLSSRYISSLAKTLNNDEYNKALFAAESLAETLLLKDDNTLIDYAKNNNCNENCILTFEDGTNAYATLDVLGDNNLLNIQLKKGEYFDVNLQGIKNDQILNVCWNSNSSITSDYVSQNDEEYKIESYFYSSFDINNDLTNFSAPLPYNEYKNCFQIELLDIPIMLSIKSLYDNAEIFLLSNYDNPIPINGIKLNITGKYYNNTKKLEITRYLDNSIDLFNYAIVNYSNTGPLLK